MLFFHYFYYKEGGEWGLFSSGKKNCGHGFIYLFGNLFEKRKSMGKIEVLLILFFLFFFVFVFTTELHDALMLVH